VSRSIDALSDGDSPCHVGSGAIDHWIRVVSFEEIEDSALHGISPLAPSVMNGWIYVTGAPVSWLRCLSPAMPDPLARSSCASNKWRQVLRSYIGILDL
jgi:hypothetical protein